MNLQNISIRQIVGLIVLVLAILLAVIGKLDLITAGLFAALGFADLF